jgi:hypothetical protein
MNDLQTIAARMQSYAQDAVECVRAKLRAELDYTPDSSQTLEVPRG